MKFVALVSGGKDSCFNAMHCIALGHELIAIANLHPMEDLQYELDSYMFQTVGHDVVAALAECMGNIPLYRQRIKGTSLVQSLQYNDIVNNDEVEDMFQLLQHVKEMHPDIKGVSVGAILSDYQRIRVEHVCERLGLIAMAFLWRRDQTELLTEMAAAGVNAVLIKVAAMGLKPTLHLGRSIADMLPTLEKLRDSIGLNVCGEGGEYETLTLDCPLFTSELAIETSEVVVHSDDAFAPVAYMRFPFMRVKCKSSSLAMKDKSHSDLVARMKGIITASRIQSKEVEDRHVGCRGVHCDYQCGRDDSDGDSGCHLCAITIAKLYQQQQQQQQELQQSNNHMYWLPFSVPVDYVSDGVSVYQRSNEGPLWISVAINASKDSDDIKKVAAECLEALENSIKCHGRSISEVSFVTLYVRDMATFTDVNGVYRKYFKHQPPARVCVQACLPIHVPIMLDVFIGKVGERRNCMHVQGLSHWAPANIGPYSQTVTLNDKYVYIAGQIAMIPASLEVHPCAHVQAERSIQNLSRVLSAVNTSLVDVAMGVCYLTRSTDAPMIFQHWNAAYRSALASLNDGSEEHLVKLPPMAFVVVPALPKAAVLEWAVVCYRDISLRTNLWRRYEYQSTSNNFHVSCALIARSRNQQDSEEDEDDDDFTENHSVSILSRCIVYPQEYIEVHRRNLSNVISYALISLRKSFSCASLCDDGIFATIIGSLRIFYVISAAPESNPLIIKETVRAAWHEIFNDTFTPSIVTVPVLSLPSVSTGHGCLIVDASG